jgi:hypothetical protein
VAPASGPPISLAHFRQEDLIGRQAARGRGSSRRRSIWDDREQGQAAGRAGSSWTWGVARVTPRKGTARGSPTLNDRYKAKCGANVIALGSPRACDDGNVSFEADCGTQQYSHNHRRARVRIIRSRDLSILHPAGDDFLSSEARALDWMMVRSSLTFKSL